MIGKATTLLRVIPLRAAASHRSEMISQVLFGEDLLIEEEEGDFVKVQMVETSYVGWVQKSQIWELGDNFVPKNQIVGLDNVFISRDGIKTALYPGTKIVADSTIENAVVGGEPRNATLSVFGEQFPKLIDLYLQTTYLWGGRTLSGIDCSGFSQAIFAHFGIAILRDAYQQATQGTVVDFLPEAKAGDLSFFDNAEGRITHVGIMIDPQTIVHASGEVRIDKIDQEGIFNARLNTYTHKLRITKRYF